MKRILTIVFSVLLGSAGISCACHCPEPAQATPVTENRAIISAMFHCAEGKFVKAVFFNDKVELGLSDGRHMLLLHAISADGARYTNADELFVFWNKDDKAFIEEGGKTTFQDCAVKTDDHQASTGLANPASVHCVKSGGKVVILKRGDGGEYGICYFYDDKACEEWALLRGQCPVGGTDTAGLTTIDQKYCAWSGGKVSALPYTMCVFKDGSKCSTMDFYNGKCPVPESK